MRFRFPSPKHLAETLQNDAAWKYNGMSSSHCVGGTYERHLDGCEVSRLEAVVDGLKTKFLAAPKALWWWAR